jgi:hypothetical protein
MNFMMKSPPDSNSNDKDAKWTLKQKSILTAWQESDIFHQEKYKTPTN